MGEFGRNCNQHNIEMLTLYSKRLEPCFDGTNAYFKPNEIEPCLDIYNEKLKKNNRGKGRVAAIYPKEENRVHFLLSYNDYVWMKEVGDMPEIHSQKKSRGQLTLNVDYDKTVEICKLLIYGHWDDVTLSSDEVQRDVQLQEMPMMYLKKVAEAKKSDEPKYVQYVSNGYHRDDAIAKYAKRRAEGKCQLCKKEAPFKNKYGEPYLETHHIVWLSRGGADSIENTTALCPNCHKKMHIVDDMDDVNKLKQENISLIRS